MQTLSRTGKPTVPLPSQAAYIYPFVVCLVYGVFSKYFFLCVVAGFALTLIVKELWRPFIPAIWLYFFTFQWAQVFTVVPYLDFLKGNLDYTGQPVDIQLDTYGAQFLVAMSLLQVALMALVVGFYLKKVTGIVSFTIKRAVLQLDTPKILIGFFVSTFVFPFLLYFTRDNPSLNQLIQSATVIRMVFLLLLIFILFAKTDRFRPIIIAIIVAEFILGFTFFSGFKDIVLFVVIVYLTVNPAFKPSVLLKISPAVLVLVFVLVFWSYVKPGYREFVSGGSRQQVVTVSREESLGYLGNQLKTFDYRSFDIGTEILLERTETMTLYFKVYERVPNVIPHTNGGNLMSSIRFLTMPRSWNPDKEVLDPSTKSTYYTGVRFATAAEGTSIAMGYFPDLYIDFGIYGMIVPLLLLALFMGWGTRYVLQRKEYNTLFNYSLLIGAVFLFGTLDSDITFFLGALRNLVAVFILGYWFVFPWLNRLITK